MGTAATPTKIAGITGVGGWFEAWYTLALDTTTATGYQTVDLTDDFDYIYGASIEGSAEECEHKVSVEKPLPTVALTSTNLKLWFHTVSGNPGAVTSVDSTDLSAVITKLTLRVSGKQKAS